MEDPPTLPEAAQTAESNALADPFSATTESADTKLTEEHDQVPSNTAASAKLQELTDAVLHFLSNASNETLAACVVGLCAFTYLLLGRVGLVLIGAVGGIVLHATWEASTAGGLAGQSSVQEGHRKRRELGIEVVRRTLDWRDTSKKLDDSSKFPPGKSESAATSPALDYDDFRPATQGALNVLTDAVIQNYVKWWYTPILPSDETFPYSCRQTLIGFIRSLANHLSRKRPADPFLDFFANSTSILIVFLNELSNAIQASQRQSPEEAVRTYLQYRPESSLANVLSVQQQERKLSLVADDILQNFLDARAYNCPPVKSFLREILSGLVLEMTIKSCSKPEWINGWIVYLLEDGEPELMNVIDEGVETTIGTSRSTPAADGEEIKGHRRRISRAEEAMQEAMLEAKRLNEMIREEDARKQQEFAISESEDALSTVTTDGGAATPTSSDSEPNRNGDRSTESSRVLDSAESANPHQPTTPQKPASFTDFGQIVPSQVPTTVQSSYTSPPRIEAPTALQLTLHNASITVLDDGDPNDMSIIRQKPTTEYLLQIEPALSKFPGWMIPRKYSDFESLHETLRRISVISGVPEFAGKYAALPGWKAQSRSHFRQALERYLQFALRYEALAESNAMKGFLEKETGLQKAPSSKNVLGFQNPNLEAVGKGFINVLGQAPKGLAGGGKAVLGGVQGVFGAVATGVSGQKRPSQSRTTSAKSGSVSSLPRADGYRARASQDISRTGSSLDIDRPPLLPARTGRPSSDHHRSRSSSKGPHDAPEEGLHLPPPPSDMPDDYKQVSTPLRPELPTRPEASAPTSPAKSSPLRETLQPEVEIPDSSKAAGLPLTEEETRVSVELMFAIITELYSLSSAWTIRLSLLGAAKTFLLRPNNPQLESIRALLQDSVIDANFSDSGLAGHIYKLRENALPTEEELKKWPAELTPAEKENLRIKARKLLVERGMPQALTSVMGAAASGEALGRVHDCLMVPEVARGLIFALLLQALRAATQ